MQHIGLVVPIGDLLGLFSGRSDILRCRLGPSSPEPLRTSEEKYFFKPALHQDVACLGLLEQVDTLLDPHAELLLSLLTLVQVPLGQHFVHLVGFSSFIQVLGDKIEQRTLVLDGHLTSQREPRMVPRSFWYPGSMMSYTLATSSAYFFTWEGEGFGMKLFFCKVGK